MEVGNAGVCGSALRRILHRAGAESARETERHCMAGSSGDDRAQDEAAQHEEGLAWIAARITQEGWDLCGEPPIEVMAPIAWAVQEMMEWASHLKRFQLLGDLECRAPITWLPSGTDHPLGTSDMTVAVEERFRLLCDELYDSGVIVQVEDTREVA